MPLTVQHVPADHPYPRAVRPLDAEAAPDVEFWPDPPVPGAPAHRWWPPQALTPTWIREHRPDVLHVHFGFEHFTADELAEAARAQHEHGGALVVTVHDLENPHLSDQGPHRERLSVLLAAADAVLTLTPGAAAEAAREHGVRPLVVPHPHVLPLDELAGEDDAADGTPGQPSAADSARPGADRPARLLLHAKDLRAQVDPVGLLPRLAEAVDMLAARGLDVAVTVDVQDSVQDEAALDALAVGCREHGFEVWSHPRWSDERLHAVLAGADVSVLPYRTGTHSGWVEMCRDLGVPVAVADIGHVADQPHAWREQDGLAAFDAEDAESLADALASLLRPRAERTAATASARAAQRRRVAGAHVGVYRAALERRRGEAGAVSVLVITGHRDAHLARLVAGLERSHRRPDQVVIVFMDQPDGTVAATDLPVTVGHVGGEGGLPLAAARNEAARLAIGDVLVFLDVDCIPAADAVGTLAAEVRARPGALVTGSPRYLGPRWLEGLDGAELEDGVLRRLSRPHPARAVLRPGPSTQWALVWTLVMAIGADDLAALGGFDEGFRGYGAEDTDLAFRARDAGLTLVVSPAEAFHQHHGVMRPPLQHFDAILANAHRFRDVHGTWPMDGWLRAFADRGLVAWDPEGDRLEALRAPTDAELEAARDEDAAF